MSNPLSYALTLLLTISGEQEQSKGRILCIVQVKSGHVYNITACTVPDDTYIAMTGRACSACNKYVHNSQDMSVFIA